MYKKVIDSDILGESIMICRTTDNAWIPEDPENTEYQQHLAWVAEGNEPEIVTV